jgi:hypothetical protein
MKSNNNNKRLPLADCLQINRMSSLLDRLIHYWWLNKTLWAIIPPIVDKSSRTVDETKHLNNDHVHQWTELLCMYAYYSVSLIYSSTLCVSDHFSVSFYAYDCIWATVLVACVHSPFLLYTFFIFIRASQSKLQWISL